MNMSTITAKLLGYWILSLIRLYRLQLPSQKTWIKLSNHLETSLTKHVPRYSGEGWPQECSVKTELGGQNHAPLGFGFPCCTPKAERSLAVRDLLALVNIVLPQVYWQLLRQLLKFCSMWVFWRFCEELLIYVHETEALEILDWLLLLAVSLRVEFKSAPWAGSGSRHNTLGG